MGLLPNQDEINLFVNECDISIELKKKYKAHNSLASLMGEKWVNNNKSNYGSDVWELNEEALSNPASYIGIYKKDEASNK